MTITKEEAIQKIKDGFPFSDSLFDAFRDDREVVLAAVTSGPSEEHLPNAIVINDCLSLVSDRLKADKGLVLIAVKQSEWSLQYASPDIQELCKDKDPIEALEAAIRKEKFQAALPDKPEVKRKKTF